MAKRDDDDDRISNADDRLTRKVRERAAQAEHSRTSDDVTTIRVSDDDDDDEEIEREVSRGRTETPADAESRREQRRNRYREQVQARERADDEARKLREENEQLRMRAVSMETMRQFMPAPRQDPRPDPMDREISVTERELANVQADFRRLHEQRAASGQPLTMAEIDEWNEKARKLDREVSELRIRKEMRGQGPQRPQGDPQLIAQETYLRMQYPDVMGDELMRATAVVRAQRIMRERGVRVADAAIVQQAIEETRSEFGLSDGAPVRHLPTQRAATRSPGFLSKFGGAPSGSSGRGGDEGRRGEVVMGKAEKRMARAMYPTLPEDKAYAMWAKKVGTKVQSG